MLNCNLLLLLAIGGCLFLCSCSTFDQPKEKTLVINSHPTFEKDEFVTSLVVKVETKEISALWPDSAPKPETLDPKKEYEFEFLLEKYKMSLDGTCVSNGEIVELVRIGDRDRIIYDASICSIHKVKMTRELVPISYGLIIFEPGFGEAYSTTFPNIGLALGGCSIDPYRKETYQWVCPECMANHDKWMASREKSDAKTAAAALPK